MHFIQTTFSFLQDDEFLAAQARTSGKQIKHHIEPDPEK